MIICKRRHFHAQLAGLAAIILMTGCASLRLPIVPAPPPASQAGAALAARTGFNAVYEGELRIWFRSLRMIWYVAVTPGATNLSAAVLSPVGIKIMQMSGSRDGHSCTIAMPAAQRLKPYGDALWSGLLWGLADEFAGADITWTRQGERLRGDATRGPLHVRYEANAIDGALTGKEILSGGKRLYGIRFYDGQNDGNRWYPNRIEIKTTNPGCSLLLKLKRLHWNDIATGKDDATGQ